MSITIDEGWRYTAVVEASETALVLNSQMELNALTSEGTVASITVRAPVRRSGLRVTTIDRNEPGIFGALLVHMMSGDPPANLTPDEYTRLRDIGFLVPPDRVASPVWYSCDVLDPPLDLVPRRALRSAKRAKELSDPVVNPTLRHLGSTGPTASMRGRVKLRNRFRTDRSWLLLQETDLCAPSLYSYSQDGGACVDELVAGESAPETLRGDVREQLLTARVLESAVDSARRGEDRKNRIAQAGKELHDRRYTVLRHVIAPLQIAAARRYYRDAISEGFLVAGDAEWPNRPFSSRDAIARFFHTQMNALVSEIAGAPLKPSFSFFASYRTGAELPAHRDREQCEYALSILVDFSPEPDDLSPWPIFVQPPTASVATPIALGIGDAVLYYGREVRHYREVLTQSEFCSCWFFFYVDQDFDGSLD